MCFLKLSLYSDITGMSPACLQTASSRTVILFFLRFFPRHDALKLGKDFAKQTNCSVSDIVCLLSLTPQAVLAAQMKTSRAPQTPAYAHQIWKKCSGLPTQLHKQAGYSMLICKRWWKTLFLSWVMTYWKTKSWKLRNSGPLKGKLKGFYCLTAQNDCNISAGLTGLLISITNSVITSSGCCFLFVWTHF